MRFRDFPSLQFVIIWMLACRTVAPPNTQAEEPTSEVTRDVRYREFQIDGLKSDRVGDWGDSKRLTIQGAKTFSADSIRGALFSNFDVLVAAHPLAPLADYPRSLVEHAKQGYLRAGFPQVKVEAHLDETNQQIVLTIDEGPRFRCGKIVASDTPFILAQQIVDWLNAQQPPAGAMLAGFAESNNQTVAQWEDAEGNSLQLQDPVWLSGLPVQFDDAGKAALKENVRRALAELGCPWADFEIELLQDTDQGTAQLEIKIKDTGPPAIVNLVTVNGNQRDSVDDVLDYLHVPMNVILPESQRTALWHKLWMSGRYLKHDVELIPPPKPNGVVELRITLVEYDKATPLAKPLSPEEKALLKCREWLLAAPQRGDDWVFRFATPTSGSAIVSPANGFLIHLIPRNLDNGHHSESGNDRWQEGLFAITSQCCTFENLVAGRKIFVPLPSAVLKCDLGARANADANDPDHPFRLNAGLGVSSNSTNQKHPPMEMQLSFPPVWMIGVVHHHNPKCSIENGVLTISGENGFMKASIDTNSGQLISLGWGDEDTTDKSSTISLVHDAFKRELLSTEDRSKIVKNNLLYDPQQPFSSIVNYFLADPITLQTCHSVADFNGNGDKFDRLLVALQKATKAGLLKPIDNQFASTSNDSSQTNSGDDFEIPDEFGESQDSWSQLVVNLTRMAIYESDQIFPRDSTPWMMMWDVAFWIMRKSDYLQADTTRIWQADDFGPVDHLFAAWLYTLVDRDGRDNIVRAIAEHGLTKLDVEKFAAELRPLLNRDKLAGQCIYHFAAVLRELDEEDVTVLGSAVAGRAWRSLERRGTAA